MRRFLNFLFLSGIIMFLGACSEGRTEDPTPIPTPIPDPTPVKVEMRLEADQMETRAIDENAIDDVNIYFFGQQETVNYHFYYPEYTPSFVFQVMPGKYELYVVTNVHQDLGEMEEADLMAYSYNTSDMTEDLPMVAHTSVNILYATALPTVQVKRAAARISYSISVASAVASKIKLRSVQFMCVPKTTAIFGSEMGSIDKNDYFDDDVIKIDDEKSYSGVYYMFENCQGEVSSITDQKDKSPENAPSCATYMRILADNVESQSGELLEYIVYLGENTTSNFDVRRNTKHTMNLVIRGENEIDNRVTVYDGLYYGNSNSYICEGTQVTIDVTAYRTSKSLNYAYTGVPAGTDYDPVAAKIVYATIPWSNISLSLNDNQLTVDIDWPDENGHNILVAVVDGNDEILWSFHIWHPKTTIQDEEYTNKNGEKFMVMDRNLGEMSTGTRKDATTTNCHFAVFEWGRKDPFWYYDEHMYIDDSDSFSYWQTVETPDKETVVTMEDLHRNPTIFYGDGYTPEYNQWGDPDNNMETYGWTSAKSIYDPCPEGYRVPNAKTWTGFSDQTVGSYLCGYSFKRNKDDMEGTYYPQGFMKRWNAYGYFENYVDVNGGRYWTSSPQYMDFTKYYTTLYYRSYESYGKNTAIAIRCARE